MGENVKSAFPLSLKTESKIDFNQDRILIKQIQNNDGMQADEENCQSTEDFPFPVPRILAQHRSVTERYYEARFFIPKSDLTKLSRTCGQCLLFHSNKLSLVTLAPDHPIIRERKKLSKIVFEACCLTSRVRGKQKKGGQVLKENTILCKIHCQDGQIYSVFAGIRSQLAEINERLQENPQLTVDKTWSDGYIAILLPFLREFDQSKAKLATYEEYTKLIDKQTNSENEIKTGGDKKVVTIQ